VVAAFVAAGLTALSGRGWRVLVEAMLPARGSGLPEFDVPAGPRLRATLGAGAAVELVCLIIWAVTGRTSAWPAWTALGLFLPGALQAAIHYRRRLASSPRWETFAAQALVSAVLFAVCFFAWLIPGGGYFWPVWPLLGLGIGLGLKAMVAYGAQSENRALTPRVEQLTRTRAGAVEARDDELARIERDLHDGAQARLVAVAMSLGLAEDRLNRDPEGARELVLEAQQQARSAIRELRDLARGIAPPVLADRGLQAAVEALAVTSPLDVSVRGDAGPRPDPAIERAAYFVAAEALANASKHAGATRIAIALERTPDRLTVEVADNGRGGADPAGAGLSGLRARVEAIDGRLEVTSPSGEGTIIRASLPCASS
jgi:signal transduction histidine kinase